MHGFEKSGAALEFPKIIADIAQKCVSEVGRARLLASRPITHIPLLEETLRQVQEMRAVYQSEGGFPIWDFVDVRILFARIEPEESYLEIADFVRLQNFLELVDELRQFRQKHAEKYASLQSLLAQLDPVHSLLNQFRFTFESSERVFDNASPELKAIRREMSRLDAEIHIRLERIMRKHAEHIQEEYFTLRDGRLVLPVREFSVSKVPGIVHGQSGSGATYFVEPMSVVQLNNEMLSLAAAERKEIVKILKRLTKLTRAEEAAFTRNLQVLIELDVLQAKARDANEFNCVQPAIAASFTWILVNARHPVLQKRHPKETVPLNLETSEAIHQIIISGPNAGGKTVALKTVGLLQLLFQCGFHVPADEGTALPVCEQIFAVIGDDQSIEDDLSTFSSHLQALQEILNEADRRSLILIDEIGSGTEPGGGAALAIAVLEELNRDGRLTIATTHQNQLKYYASEAEGVQNAAMQFDSKELRPLFTLEWGIPGSSYTFEICRRLGLDETILNRAIELSGKEHFKLDRLLAEVSESSQKYNRLRQKLSVEESRLNGLIQLYQVKSDTLSKKRKQFEKEAKDEARQILETVNKEVEKTIREIRESQADKQVVKKARARLNTLKARVNGPEKAAPKPSFSIKDLSVGQRARSVQYEITGVISKIFRNRGEVELEQNGLKISVPLSDLELLSENGSISRVEQKESGAAESAGVNIHNELDLRGLTTDEAIRETERYIDQALLSNWNEVRLVHGKGTGALRQAIHAYLRGLTTIKRFRLGKWGEGDTGVTVVEL